MVEDINNDAQIAEPAPVDKWSTPPRVGPKPTEVQEKHAAGQAEETARRQAYDIEHAGEPLSDDEVNRRAEWDNRKLGADYEAGDRAYPLHPYIWMATHTAAKDATIYRRAIAEDPHSVPLRVWQFCEENNVDVCLFDGVRAREVTELEEALALSPPHAHAQIRGDGAILDVARADADKAWSYPLESWKQEPGAAPPPDYPPPPYVEPSSSTAPRVASEEPVEEATHHDGPSSEPSSGE